MCRSPAFSGGGLWRDGFPGEWPTKSLGKPGAATARLAGWIDGASANSRMRDGRTEAPWTATRKP